MAPRKKKETPPVAPVETKEKPIKKPATPRKKRVVKKKVAPRAKKADPGATPAPPRQAPGTPPVKKPVAEKKKTVDKRKGRVWTKEQRAQAAIDRKKAKKDSLEPEDYPLTALEQKFINELKKDPANRAAAYRRAGYSPNNANKNAEKLSKKPNVAKAIYMQIGRTLEDENVTADTTLRRMALIAMTPTTDVVRFYGMKKRPGRDPDLRGMVITDYDDLTEGGRALISEISQTIAADGSITHKVKTQNQLEALKVMCQYFRILDKGVGQTKVRPSDDQVQALEDVIAGKKTPIEAALFLESRGEAVPDTLKLLIARPQTDHDPLDDTLMPTAEEMWERRKEKLAEIERQKEGLPKVREEIAEIKKELGDKVDSFKPGVVGDGGSDV